MGLRRQWAFSINVGYSDCIYSLTCKVFVLFTVVHGLLRITSQPILVKVSHWVCSATIDTIILVVCQIYLGQGACSAQSLPGQ